MTLLFLLNLCFFTGATNFQICGNAKSGHTLSIPQTIQCRPPASDSHVFPITTKVYVPRTQPTVTTAYKCHLQINTVCTNMGFFGSRGITFQKTEIKTIPTYVCMEVFETKNFQNQNLTQTSPDTWSTGNTLDIEYEWCCKDNCKTTTNFNIQTGQVATWDGIHIGTDLGESGGCRAPYGKCVLDDGILVWNATNFDK